VSRHGATKGRHWIFFLDWGLDLHAVRFAIMGGVAFSAFRAMLTWIVPVPLKLIFDSVFANHPLPSVLSWMPANHTDRLYILVAAMVVIAVLLGLTAYGADMLLAGAGQKVVFDLRTRLFRHLTAQSAAFHHRRMQGDLLARLGGDVQAMQSVVVNVVPVVAENVLTVFGMLVIMFVLQWQFSLLAMSLLPVLWLVMRHYMAAIKTAQREARRNEGNATAAAQQILVALPVVQAFGTEQAEVDRYGTLASEGLTANRRAILLQSRFTPMVTLLMTTSTVLVMLYGGTKVLSGQLTPGDLLLFSAYFGGMYTPARQLAKLAGTIGVGQASAERVTEVLNTHDEVPVRPAARRPASVSGRIEYDQVSFAHPDSGIVLDNIQLEIPAGHRQALVGSTGAGKSTMLRLVPRFIDPTMGAVRLDGIDLRDLDLEWLRRNVALVPQELALLRPTVWENVVYGSDWTTRADAEAAARAVGVHDVLAGLRDGYDTEVGEAGSGLSGGQRQCIAVARAMARDAKVLLLDEPTTGLDATTQSVVVDALERLSDGRTTLIVSHQLNAVHNADRITVVSHGRMVEHGTHHELVAGQSAYRDLYTAGAPIDSSPPTVPVTPVTAALPIPDAFAAPRA
jgi:ATP-binding cassette subfamily B protein/subfamily B ATP-binding cassette protein MsbA